MGAKEITAKVKNNMIGTIAGAGLTYWAVKKYTGISGTWKIVGLTVLGAVVGAYGQSMINAKLTTPKKADIKK